MIELRDVPQDARLPRLAAAVDPETLCRYLAPHFEPAARLLRVKVDRFAYKPGRNARLTFALKLRDRATGAKVRHLMHARMEPAEAIERLHDKMSRRAWTAPPYGPAMLRLPELDLLVWGFPNDPKLDGIAEIATPVRFAELLARLPGLATTSAASLRSTVVKYVPGKRLVMRHDIETSPEPTTLYTKTFAHARGGAIYRVMRHLWEAAADDPRALTTPEPLGYLADQHTLVQRALPGWSAVTTLHGDDWEGFMQRVGRGLAAIHHSDVRGLEPWTLEDEHANFMNATDLLLRYDATLQSSVAPLRAAVERRIAQVPEPEVAPIHTAFRFTQLLAHDGRLALLDFDGFRTGDPACDVASFLAHLQYLEVKGEIDPAQAAAAQRHFLDAYRAAASDRAPVGRRALLAYTAMILVAKHAQKCVKRLKDDGDRKIDDLIRRALDLLERPDAFPARID